MMSVVLGIVGLVIWLWLLSDSGDFGMAAGGAVMAAALGVVFGQLSRLSGRQRELAYQVEQLRRQAEAAAPAAAAHKPAEPAVAPAQPQPVLPKIPYPVVPQAERPPAPVTPAAHWALEVEPPAPSHPDLFDTLFERVRGWIFGGNTAARAGVLLLFLGLAFLLRYASERFSIPIELRYAAVAAAGLVLLAIGWRLREHRRGYGLMLQGAAIGVLYLTIFAALRLDPLISPAACFALLVALVVGSSILAVLQDSRGLAAVAAIGGFAAPVLAGTEGDHHIVLFTYLLLLDAGILSIAWFKAWRPLNLIGFAGTIVLTIPWAAYDYQPAMLASTEPFLLAFFLMFVAIAVLFTRRVFDETAEEPPQDQAALLLWAARRSSAVDGILLFGAPIAAFALQAGLMRPYRYGAAFSALGFGLFYMALAARMLRPGAHRSRTLAEVFIALGVIFGTLAVPLGLDARWTSAAWAIEGAGVYWLAVKQDRRLGRAFAALVQFGAALAYLATLVKGDGTPLVIGSRLGAAMLAGALLSSFWQLHRMPLDRQRREDRPLQAVFTWGGLYFLALLAPLSMSAGGTAIAWALLSVAVLAIGLQLNRRPWLVAALALLAGGGVVFLSHGPATKPIDWIALADTRFWAPAMLGLAGFVAAWQFQRAAASGRSWYPIASNTLLGWGVLWWGGAWLDEIHRFLPLPAQAHAAVLVAAGTALAFLPAVQRWRWPALAQLSAGLLPVADLALLASYSVAYHPAGHLGFLAWPAALAVHLLTLRRNAALLPQDWRSPLHVLGCWLALAVLALEARYGFLLLSDRVNAWRWLGWAAILVLYLLAAARARVPSVWPFTEFEREYRVLAAAPVAIVLLVWLWCGALFSDGDAAPLPYLPLFNPLELGQISALFVILLWFRERAAALPSAVAVPPAALYWVLGPTSLLLLTGTVLRTCHHWAGIEFAAGPLLGSMLVQASLSMLWAAAALGLMIFGHARSLRAVWIAGAALIGAVVIKLFLIELTNTGGLPRIVSFIGVGVLLLITGYFAPLPPRQPALPHEATP